MHRIGRTARVGRQGVAWSFVTPDQGQLLTEIEKLTGVLIEQLDYPDFNPGPLPQGVREQRERDAIRRGDAPADPSQRAEPVAAQQLPKGELERMFPGGVLPKNLPARSLGSKLRSKRGRR